MAVTKRAFMDDCRFGEDYFRIHSFLRRINSEGLVTPNFTWGRWEWMISHYKLDMSNFDKIGIWENDRNIIALATYENKLGEAFVCVDDSYANNIQLKREILSHARQHLRDTDGKLCVIIADGDRVMQRLAWEMGYRATQSKEHVSLMDIDQQLTVNLPEGFRFLNLSDSWDFCRYHQVMWRGFHPNGGEPVCSEENIAMRRTMLSGPHLRSELVLAIVAPNGDYASHCGIWYLPGDRYAYIEPVATDPQYRNLGLGKAVVWEAVRRSGSLGAKEVIVGSDQQFYYSIGFAPIYNETWWQYLD